jgi:hypothetical protein
MMATTQIRSHLFTGSIAAHAAHAFCTRSALAIDAPSQYLYALSRIGN